jgi:hypothetical protein
MIARWDSQVLIRRGIVKHLDSPEQSASQVKWDSLGCFVSNKEVAQPIVPEVHDHQSKPALSQCTTPWYIMQE